MLLVRIPPKALVDHLMKMLTKQGTNVLNDEVQWILTVPAIWTDTAKQSYVSFKRFPAGTIPVA
jgi:molecular chaperone DnaK (HSP70)